MVKRNKRHTASFWATWFRKNGRVNGMSESFSLKGIWRPTRQMSRVQRIRRALQNSLLARSQRKQASYIPKRKGMGVTQRNIALFLGGACLTGFLYVFAPTLFSVFMEKSGYARVEEIVITGNSTLLHSDIYRKSGLLLYQTKIFDIEEDAVAERIKDFAWVKDAVVDVGISSVVEIRVQEQKPIALIHNADEENSFSYLGRSGDIFVRVQQGDSLDFPVITGLSNVAEGHVEKSLKDIVTFLKRLGTNNPNFPMHSLSEIHVAEDGNLTLYLVDHSFPIYVGDTEINNAYKWLVKILADIYARPRGIELAKIDYIQLDYMKDRVLVAENGSS